MTYGIVLDTNCFGVKSKYNFNKSSITICLNNLNNFDNIRVFLPSIVYEELKHHIREVIESVESNINSTFLKQHLKKSQLDLMYEEKVKELDKFIKKYHITIIDCNKYSSNEQVNEWYFNSKYPFSPKKPKEFPDAMILSASINYFKENKYDEVIMISNDNDIINGIKENSDFKVERTIQKVLSKLTNFTEEEIRKCEKYIKENEILKKEDTYSFYIYDNNDNYEIDNIEYEINDIEMIDKNEEDKYYQLYVKCSLKLEGEFNLVDQVMSYYDKEDPECSAIWYRSGEELEIKDVGIFIAINYDQNKLKDYTITKVEDIALSDYFDQLEIVEQ